MIHESMYIEITEQLLFAKKNMIEWMCLFW